MATIREFLGQLQQVEGIGGYLLVRRDGHLVAHQVDDPEGLASLVAMLGLAAGQIQTGLGLQNFRHLVLEGGERNLFLLVSLGNYFLGVVPAAEASGPQMTAAIMRFLRSMGKGRPASEPQGGDR